MEMHHAAGHGGGIDLLKSCMIILFMLAMIVFWIRMLISAIQNKGLEETDELCSAKLTSVHVAKFPH